MPTPQARLALVAGRVAVNVCGAAASAWWLLVPSAPFRDLLPDSMGVVLAVVGAVAFTGATAALLSRQPWLEIGCLSLASAVLLAHAVALLVAPGLNGDALVAVGLACANGQQVLDVWWLVRQGVTRGCGR